VGTWASGLYGNDATCDVRDACVGLLRDQVGDDEAYAVMLERFAVYMGDRLSGTCRVWYDLERPYGSHDPPKSYQSRSGSGVRGFGASRVGRTR